MMKKAAILIAVFGFITSSLFAQPINGGPDTFGYTFKTSQDTTGPTFQWFDISQIGTFVSGLADDNYVGPFPISNFPYYSSTPTNLYIGSNGYISFVPGNIASTAASFPAIPNSNGTNNFIAPLLTDLNFAGSANPGSAYYYNRGDTICVTFEKVPFWTNNSTGYSGLNTFQVILNRADSSITINYKTQQGLPDPTYVNNYLSIGIENGTGLDGLQYYRGTTFPNDSLSLKFYYPTVIQNITELELAWNNNEENGGKFILPNQSFSPTVNVKNSGNQNVSSPITANYQIIDTAKNILASGNAQIQSLNAGDDSTLSFSTSFTPTVAGRCTLKTFITKVNGDVIASNDTNTSLIIISDTSKYPLILDYTEGFPSAGGVSWSGGNAGVGVYIEPPFYPAVITGANFYISGRGNPPGGFYSILYDDDARGGGPGTILDSSYIPPTSYRVGAYTRDSIPATTINSGGVYLLWLMDTNLVTLGAAFNIPASNYAFEYIGGAWAPYRSGQNSDFLMNIEVQPVSVGLDAPEPKSIIVNAYPNPSSDFITIELNQNAGQFFTQLRNIKGEVIEAKIMNFGDKLRVYKGNLAAGNYILRVGDYSRKVTFID